LDHFFDLFQGRKLSSHFHGSLHYQGRGDHHSVVADLFDVLYLYDLGFNAEFFDRLLGSILELVALGSTHPQDFDFLHANLLSKDSVYEIYPFPQGRFMSETRLYENRPHNLSSISWFRVRLTD
jgi:hypothetical protein